MDPIHPFTHSRLQPGLHRMLLRNRRDLDPVRTAITHLMASYEARRSAGHHDGPPLRGMNIYLVEWTLDP